MCTSRCPRRHRWLDGEHGASSFAAIHAAGARTGILPVARLDFAEKVAQAVQRQLKGGEEPVREEEVHGKHRQRVAVGHWRPGARARCAAGDAPSERDAVTRGGRGRVMQPAVPRSSSNTLKLNSVSACLKSWCAALAARL